MMLGILSTALAVALCNKNRDEKWGTQKEADRQRSYYAKGNDESRRYYGKSDKRRRG